jgi:ketosteroid isomerase-like protein
MRPEYLAGDRLNRHRGTAHHKHGLILEAVNAPNANAELVQKMLAAYLTGDEDTLRAMIGPEGEIHGDPGIINAGTYHGFDGFQEWIKHWEEAWEELNYELREPIAVGEHFIVLPAHITGRGAGSGVEIDSVFGWMYEIRDGRLARFHAYDTVERAVEVAERLADP